MTVCTDLLKPGAFPATARRARYFGDLGKRMSRVGARDIDHFRSSGQGQAEAALAALAPPTRPPPPAAPRSGKGDLRAAAGPGLSRAGFQRPSANTETLPGEDAAGSRATAPPRTPKPPTKSGTRLWLFDCLTCDKCIPVCPNDANFVLAIPRTSSRSSGGDEPRRWTLETMAS